MINFSGSLTQLKRSDVELMRRIANNDPLLTQDEIGKWDVLSTHTDPNNVIQTQDYLLASMVNVPSMIDKDDKLPRFLKTISPSIVYQYASDDTINNDGKRKVAKVYMGATFNSFGYHFIEKSNTVTAILEPMIKLFFMNKNELGEFISATQSLEIPQDIGGDVEDDDYVLSYKFNETNDLYIGVGFDTSLLATLTDYQIDAIISSAPSYVTLRNKVNYLPMNGEYHKSGHPLWLEERRTDHVDYAVIYKYNKITQLVPPPSTANTTGGLFTAPLADDVGTGVFDQFASVYGDATPTAHASYFLSKTGSVRTTDFYLTLLNTAQELLVRYKREGTTTQIKYYIKVVNALKVLVEYTKNDMSLSEAWDVFYDMVDIRPSQDPTAYPADGAFPITIDTRADLIFSLTFDNDYDVEEYTDYQIQDNVSDVISYDISRKTPTEVVTDEEALKQSVENIVFTSLNEYFMDDEFGIDFNGIIFELNNIDLSSLGSEIMNQVNRYEGTRLLVTNDMINIDVSPQSPNTLNISVICIIRATAKMFSINQEMSL